jgi:glycosyltransferase involved in cell wall biosynthesis
MTGSARSAQPRLRSSRGGKKKLGVLWEGAFFAHHSLANINREVALLLARRPVDLGLISRGRKQFDETADSRYRPLAERLDYVPAAVQCHVRHRWPPDFRPPVRGSYILVQPWEYGWLPRNWVEGIARSVREVWVHTRYVRDIYLRSGVDPEKVVLIPLGVNARLFHPAILPARLSTRRSFKFLFVGGGIPRKGFDLLLQAYTEEFTRADDVCLVIKDFFYGGAGFLDVCRVRRKRESPEILYFYGNMSFDEIGGLYTACDCYIHPYRSEGFGLPIAEAMACGLPVIVTGFGAALDYCDERVAYLIPARERRVPAALWDPQVRTVGPPTWAEPDKASLRRLMRHVFENRQEARRKGALASLRIRRQLTWDHTVDAMVDRLRDITASCSGMAVPCDSAHLAGAAPLRSAGTPHRVARAGPDHHERTRERGHVLMSRAGRSPSAHATEQKT